MCSWASGASRRESASATTFVRPVLNSEIKAQQFAYPMVLRNSCEALVEDVLERLTNCADDERAAA